MKHLLRKCGKIGHKANSCRSKSKTNEKLQSIAASSMKILNRKGFAMTTSSHSFNVSLDEKSDDLVFVVKLRVNLSHT